MTLLELQTVLGETIENIRAVKTDGTADPLVTKETYSKAESIARLAKQMINNADVVLRADKLQSEGKITEESATRKLVGA